MSDISRFTIDWNWIASFKLHLNPFDKGNRLFIKDTDPNNEVSVKSGKFKYLNY